MEDVRVVIMDDMPAAITIVNEILLKNGIEAVGVATNIEELKTVVKASKPNLIIMDMVMPEADGIECTRAVHKIDPEINVIIASSMMDDKIVHHAYNNKVSAYIQKPVDEDVLIKTIKSIMSTEDAYVSLQREYFIVFTEALKNAISKMTKSSVTYKNISVSDSEYTSEGITVVIGIVGKFPGKMLISLSKPTATLLSESILRRKPEDDDEIISAVSELANVVSGNACSTLNKSNREYNLRVSPPTVLTGEDMTISPPDFTCHKIAGHTAFGKIQFSAGFDKRGT